MEMQKWRPEAADEKDADACRKDIDRCGRNATILKMKIERTAKAIEGVKNPTVQTPLKTSGMSSRTSPGMSTGGFQSTQKAKPKVAFSAIPLGSGSSSNTTRIDAKEPKMGGLMEGHYGEEAWVGGQPNCLWTKLENPCVRSIFLNHLK